jgi:hypothetical protein
LIPVSMANEILDIEAKLIDAVNRLEQAIKALP